MVFHVGLFIQSLAANIQREIRNGGLINIFIRSSY